MAAIISAVKRMPPNAWMSLNRSGRASSMTVDWSPGRISAICSLRMTRGIAPMINNTAVVMLPAVSSQIASRHFLCT